MRKAQGFTEETEKGLDVFTGKTGETRKKGCLFFDTCPFFPVFPVSPVQ